MINVAPREILDLAYRCARVAGCEADQASRIARNVTFAEVHYSSAMVVLADELDGGDLATSPLTYAPDVVADAEITARAGSEAIASFNTPVPWAAIAAPIREASRRGVVAQGLDGGLTGDTPVPSFRLTLGTPEASTLHRERVRFQGAHRSGVSVDREVFARLSDAAADYLVPEALLDAIGD